MNMQCVCGTSHVRSLLSPSSFVFFLKFPLGQLDLLYKISAAGRSQQNACRNLHSLIHRAGLTLPLRIHTVEIPVRRKKPKLQKLWVHYPVILPSTWISYLGKHHSKVLLGGCSLEDTPSWKRGLKSFWEKYLKTDSDHPMNFGGPPKETTVPLYIHGDEGRGKNRLPIMTQCIQTVISFKGPGYKNSSGNLTCQFSKFWTWCLFNAFVD